MITKRTTVAAQGVELGERSEARIERGLEASGRVGIGTVNEIWDMGLKKHSQIIRQEVKRQLPSLDLAIRAGVNPLGI
jgi:hypothetical protein